MSNEIIIQLIIIGMLGIGAMILSHYHYKKIEKEFNVLLKENEAEIKELERELNG